MYVYKGCKGCLKFRDDNVRKMKINENNEIKEIISRQISVYYLNTYQAGVYI